VRLPDNILSRKCSALIVVIIITCMYICMYEYCSLSPHNGITIANLLVLIFSPVNDNFDFSWNYYYSYYKEQG
jgi:hypothetical protein